MITFITFNELLLVLTKNICKIEHILCINNLRCTWTLCSPEKMNNEKINQNTCFMHNFLFLWLLYLISYSLFPLEERNFISC